MTEQPDRLKTRWLCLLLAAVSLAVFWPVTGHYFINFDDPDYVTGNPAVQQGLTWAGLRWAFTSGHASNWHPLTWLSHMLDVQLFGLKPGWHHLTSLLFHTINSLLLFAVLRRMTGALWRSGLVAALFALHPLHVESVAWVAERKDVLSAFFWMLTLWAYSRYAEFQVSGFKFQGGERKWYGLVLLLFVLGLMSKPMLVTVPFVLLLLDYWPLRRFEVATLGSLRSSAFRLVLEKLPLFVLTLAASTVTFLVQRQGGAVASLQHTSFDTRIENMFVAYAGYILKTFWPSDLAVLYLRPENWPPEQTALSIFVLVAISILVFWQARRHRYLAVGWLWFLGTLAPVIGLVQVGNQAMADRYTYVPLIGLFIMLAWAGGEVATRWRLPASLMTAIPLAAIVGCAALTRAQLSHWRSSQTLFAHTIKVTRENFVAQNNLGYAFATQGRLEEAKARYAESLRIKPNYAEALLNMGVLLTQQGKTEEAKSYLNEAIRVRPQFAEVHAKLAFALSAEGRIGEAIASYREALRLKPIFSEALNNLAWILATNPNGNLRNGPEAVQLATRACELTHDEVPIMVGTLAAAYAEAGRFGDAITTAQKARVLALAKGQKELARKNLELLEQYRSGQPYREPAPSTDAAKPRT